MAYFFLARPISKSYNIVKSIVRSDLLLLTFTYNTCLNYKAYVDFNKHYLKSSQPARFQMSPGLRDPPSSPKRRPVHIWNFICGHSQISVV